MAVIYVKKVLEDNLPLLDTDFTMSFTEKNNLYITKQDGSQMQVTDLLTGYDDLSDLIAQDPQIEGKLYLTRENKMYVYDGVKYLAIGGESGGEGLDGKILDMLLDLQPKVETFDYDTKDNIVGVKRVYDNYELDDMDIAYEYDDRDNITKETIAKMNKIVTNSFSYDERDNVIEIDTTVADV